MAYLWWGGEDTSFDHGASPTVDTTSGRFRSGFARCGVTGGTLAAPLRGTLFPGGTVTSCWLSFRHWNNGNPAYIGLGQSGQNNFLAVLITAPTLNLVKVVAGVATNLATSSAAVSSIVQKIDLQVVSYGASSTVNVYLGGTLVFTYSGSTSLTGVTALDSVFISGSNQPTSEIVVADASTLAFQGAVTLYGTGNGTTQSWSNPAYTNYNPTTINDANSTFTNTAAQDQEVTIPSLPAGSFVIAGVKRETRAMHTAGSTATQVALGFRNGSGTVAVGSNHSLTTAFATVEDYFTTDPTTSAAWTTLASYQLDLRSA